MGTGFPWPQFPHLPDSVVRISAPQGFLEDESCDVCGNCVLQTEEVLWKHNVPEFVVRSSTDQSAEAVSGD